MTISGWIGFAFLVGIAIAVGIFIAAFDDFSGASKVLGVIVAIVIIIASFAGLRWYYSSTASGQRAMIDQRSELHNGIERVVNVYTANGDLISSYEGKIDIDTNDGGYVKFDFQGKRYIYYNCFIETIADIS